MAIAVATFLIVLAVIAGEKLHRTNVALLGAAIVVLFVGDYSQEQAIESVDFNTIGLLVGMMILVYLTSRPASTTSSRSGPASSPAAGRSR